MLKLAFRDLRFKRLGAMRGGSDTAALSLDFLAGALDPRITFTRAGTATYFGSDGLLKVAAADAPRFDYDPVNLQPKGLLIEGARTNLFLNSATLSGPASGLNSDLLTSAVAAPITGQTMMFLRETAASGNHQISFIHTLAAGLHALSVYLKAGDRTNMRYILTGTTLGTLVISANLAAGTVAVETGTGEAQIIHCGGGLYRVIAIFTAAASESIVSRIRLGNAAGRDDYVGDGISGLYLWGAQLEAGAFPTSYIPTTTTSMTRASDVALMTGTNFSAWFNPAEGAFTWDYGVAKGAVLGGVGDTFSNTQYFTTSGTSAVLVRSGNAISASLIVGSNPSGSKVAWAYKDNDFAACRDGGSLQTDALGAVPVGSVRLAIGSNPWGVDGGNNAFGHIRRLQYYNTRLPNSELQRLTS